MFALGSCLCLLHWIKFSDSPRGSRSMACTMSTNCLEVQGRGTSYVLLFCKMGFTPSSKGLCGNPQLLREVTVGTTGSSGGTCPVCTQWTFSLINRFSFVGLFLLNLLITMLQTYLDFGISYFILVPFQSFWMFFFFSPSNLFFSSNLLSLRHFSGGPAYPHLVDLFLCFSILFLPSAWVRCCMIIFPVPARKWRWWFLPCERPSSNDRFKKLQGWVVQTSGPYLQAGSCRDKATTWLPEQGQAARAGTTPRGPEPRQGSFTFAASSESARVSASASASASAPVSLGGQIPSPPLPGWLK